MGSTRLPGKAMVPIFDGKGALELMITRMRRATSLDGLIVATTTLPEDDVVADLCDSLGTPCFRGDAADVLDRFYRCADFFGARDVLVRLTGDCPLHDPEVIDTVVRFFQKGAFDYAANTHPPTFPDGLDTEVFSFAALQTAWRDATTRTEREHVTYHLYTHPEKFKIGNLERSDDLSGMRWTLDEAVDLAFIREVYRRLGRGNAGLVEVLALLREFPELQTINQHVGRNEGLAKSLAAERIKGNSA